MIEIKHTPGPWLVRRFAQVHYVMDAIPDRDGRVVANVIAAPNTNPAWEANARLIAAAPDLLRACEQALAALSWESVARALGHDDRDRIVADISAAVAKAKGECP